MKTNKYTSWQIQNEMLKVMALEVLRDVAASLHSSPFYSKMAAETTDSSNLEQVVPMGGQYFACSRGTSFSARISGEQEQEDRVMVDAAQSLVPKKRCDKH